MMIFSCRIMKKHVSIDSETSFMRFRWKSVFAIWGERVSLMEFDERKSFEVDGKVLWVEETSEKFDFLEKKFSLDQLGWNGKSWKLKLNPLFSRQSQVNPHSWDPLTLSKAKWCKWASFTPFTFGESERIPRVRVYLRFSREERI